MKCLIGLLIWVNFAYWPPSVFSFYPPGNKGALVSTAYVFIRDRVADEYVRGWSDTYIQIEKLMSKFNLEHRRRCSGLP